MITIHHLGVSQSERVVWLMEELGLPYELVWHRRTPVGAPASYLALHPAAMAPVVQDGDLVLAESEAILPYICHRHGGGRFTVSPDAYNYADYLYWMALNNNILGIFFARMAMGDATPPPPIASIMDRREDGYVRFLEQTLANRPYLAGHEFTCADIMSLFCLRFPRMLGARSGEMPNTRAYIERLSERPALIRADAVAGAAAPAPPEA